MRLPILALTIALNGIPSQVFAQDAAAGERSFKVCRACHQIGEGAKNFVGPVLNGVVGRKAGSYPGYNYSEANKTSGITWDVPTLRVYLHDPRARVPGTKMTFAGFENESDIENVISYIAGFDAAGKHN